MEVKHYKQQQQIQVDFTCSAEFIQVQLLDIKLFSHFQTTTPFLQFANLHVIQITNSKLDLLTHKKNQNALLKKK